MGPIWHPSPNFGARREGAAPQLVVLHYTAMESAEAALERLCDPVFEVSAHWLIGRDGRLWHLVDEEARAWHAGAGTWGQQGDVNSRSIGIEIDNDGQSPFSELAVAVLEQLLRDILGRWDIPPKGVIGHSDMAPGRKGDPGARFDWRRLARLGLSIWPDATGAPGEDLIQDLHRFGFGADVDHSDILSAFRARFRPGVAGPVDEVDRALAHDLAKRFAAETPKLIG